MQVWRILSRFHSVQIINLFLTIEIRAPIVGVHTPHTVPRVLRACRLLNPVICFEAKMVDLLGCTSTH